MTSSSDRKGPRQVPPPQGGAQKPAGNYSRFIPREELSDFASWQPEGFGGTPQPRPVSKQQPEPEPQGPTPEEIQAQVKAARQAGYNDGYRDGLVALESFKQSFAQQMTAQIGQLVESFEAQFDVLEQQMADALARTATQLARQVVRSELQQRPELVAHVAEEAVNAVLMSARYIRVHVNPQDHALVSQGAEEALTARGARLMSAPSVARGGCLIESDAGSIDARIETRWAQAAQALGQDVTWEGDLFEDARPPSHGAE
jgi:flagellar assembly protein FliH